MIIVCRFWRVVKPHVMRLPIIPGTPWCLVTNQSYLVYISVFACQACGLSPTAGPTAGHRENAWCLGTFVACSVKRWEDEGLPGVLESFGTSSWVPANLWMIQWPTLHMDGLKSWVLSASTVKRVWGLLLFSVYLARAMRITFLLSFL